MVDGQPMLVPFASGFAKYDGVFFCFFLEYEGVCNCTYRTTDLPLCLANILTKHCYVLTYSCNTGSNYRIVERASLLFFPKPPCRGEQGSQQQLSPQPTGTSVVLREQITLKKYVFLSNTASQTAAIIVVQMLCLSPPWFAHQKQKHRNKYRHSSCM